MKNRAGAISAHRPILLTGSVLTALFIVTVTYVFNKKDTLSQTSGDLSSLSASAALSESIHTVYDEDTDGDGLADWEELLWNTDPNIPDTDGDGVPDKKDVMQHSSSQSLALASTETRGTSTDTEPEDLGATDALARTLFGEYMRTLQNGETLSASDQSILAEQSLRSTAPLIAPPTFTTEEVRRIAATEQSRETYAREILDTFKAMLSGTTNEYAALIFITQGNREVGLQELTKTIDQYKQYTEILKTMSVPEDAAPVHAYVVESLMQYLYALEGFAVITDDPLLTVASLRLFPDIKEKLNGSYGYLRSYLETNTTVYTTPVPSTSVL